MDRSRVASELRNLLPFPLYVRDRAEQLRRCLDAALLVAERTGFSVDEVSRRINALADPIKRLILWEKDWKQGAPPSFSPQHDWIRPPVPVNYIIGDYTRVPGGPYIRYHDHALLTALPAIRELSLRASAGNDPAEGEQPKQQGKTRGKRPLEQSNPLKFQIYDRIRREQRQLGEQYADIVARLKSDKDFAEQVTAAKLKLNAKLVRQALAFFDYRAREARKDQDIGPT